MKTLQNILQRIQRAAQKAGRNPAEIQLIAVSKGISTDLIRKAYDAGQRDFGENYAQEMAQKSSLLQDLEIHWHFIGHMQRNKVKMIAPHATSITLDSFTTAKALNDRRESPINIFLEVNVGNEISKSGIAAKNLPELLQQIQSLKNLHLKGLMCIPPYHANPEASRPYFRQMRKLGKELGLQQLSMGMSHDFEIAIEEGATIVRIGSAIFGARHI